MQGREILLGVSGGIAAYKVADLASKLVQQGARVSVVMTAAATKFVGPTTFEALTGRPVYTDLFKPQEHFIGEHIGLARRAELYVIAPASANMVGKLAQGLADDLVSTLALSITCSLLVAPAMNCEMWAKPALQRNIEQLRHRWSRHHPAGRRLAELWERRHGSHGRTCRHSHVDPGSPTSTVGHVWQTAHRQRTSVISANAVPYG